MTSSPLFCKIFLTFAMLLELILQASASGPFNKTLVVLNSQGRIASVTNITLVPKGSTIGPDKTLLTTTIRTPAATAREISHGHPINASKKLQGPCGVPTVPTRMDSIATFMEWPWHVAIVEAKDDLYICGGSLISATEILTGAHCLLPYASGVTSGKVSPRPRLKIRAGEWDVSTNSEAFPHVEVLVHKMTLHPDFDDRTLENDIAVIHLARPILPNFRQNILPICLPNEPVENSTGKGSEMSTLKRCVVTGWGRKSETSGHSIILKEIIVPLWENDRCERQLWKHFGRTFVLPQTALCAGDEENDACDGDGGGPLVCYQDGTWVQEGIVSFGIGCGRSESPGVYTRVGSYLPFLKNEMA